MDNPDTDRLATLRASFVSLGSKLDLLKAHLATAVDGAHANADHLNYAAAFVRDIGLMADEKIAWMVRNPPPPAPEAEPAPAPDGSAAAAPVAWHSITVGGLTVTAEQLAEVNAEVEAVAPAPWNSITVGGLTVTAEQLAELNAAAAVAAKG